MAITKVQSNGTAGSGNVSSLSATLASATTAGNLAVAIVTQGGSTNTLTLPTGWSSAVSQNGNANQNLTLAWFVDSSGGNTSFTFTSSTANGLSVILSEWNTDTGVWNASSLDQTASNFTSTSNKSMDSGTTAATTAATELWIAGFGQGNGTASAPTNSFTLDIQQNSGGTPTNKANSIECYLLATTTGTADCGLTNSANVKWDGVIATFAPQSGGGSTPVPVSDANTSTVETAVVTASVPLTDANTSTTESVAASAHAPVVDTNTTTAETLSDTVTLTTNDTASGTDAMGFAPSVGDPAAGGESVSTSVTAPTASGGTGLDTPAVSASLPVSDTGAGADVVGENPPAGDTGTGGETFSSHVTASTSDSATGGQSVTAVITVPLVDTATGLDTAKVVTVSLPVPDSATLLETLAASVTAQVTDAGTGNESIATGGGSTPTVTDRSTGGESLAATVQLAPVDAASGIDTLSVVVVFTQPPSDTGAGSEQAVVHASLTASDAASGAQLQTLLITLPLVDTAVSADALSVSPIVISVQDLAAGVETISSTTLTVLTDPATGVDSVTVVDTSTHIKPIGDSGVGVEVVTRTVVLLTTPSELLGYWTDGVALQFATSTLEVRSLVDTYSLAPCINADSSYNLYGPDNTPVLLGE